MSSFSARATVTASTKRIPLTAGKQGAAATEEASIKCWPLAPVDGDTVVRQNLRSAYIWWQTFVEGDYDIRNGDILVIGSSEYPIGRCEAWPWMATTRFRLYVHDVRG